ncbi:MAG: hypothetical protein R2825_06390 [Saprospiraceae bacterium]
MPLRPRSMAGDGVHRTGRWQRWDPTPSSHSDQYASLANHRSNLLIPENKVLQLDSANATGLHPSMTGLQQLYNDGLMSIVQNVGYPQQDYSHFRSMDIWMTGSDSNEYLGTGWLGRTLEGEYRVTQEGIRMQMHPTGDPNRFDPAPIAFMGTSYPMGMAISSADEFYDFVNDFTGQTPARITGRTGIHIRLVMEQSQQYYESLAWRLKIVSTCRINTPKPTANQLRIVAWLINDWFADTCLCRLARRGSDTHSEQVDAMEMDQLSGFMLRC